MKSKLFLLIIGLSFAFPIPSLALTINPNLQGRILLQVEQRGEAWYVNPTDEKRYYMKDGPTAYEMMRKFGLGITNTDLKKAEDGDKAILGRIKGRIVLQVQAHGEAYYIHPDSLTLYYLKDGDAAYALMREKSLGITDTNLDLIPSGQLAVTVPTSPASSSASTLAYAAPAAPTPTPSPTPSVPEPALVLPSGPAASPNPPSSSTSSSSSSSSTQDLQQQITDLQSQVTALNNQLNPPPPPPVPKPEILNFSYSPYEGRPDSKIVSWNSTNTIACGYYYGVKAPPEPFSWSNIDPKAWTGAESRIRSQIYVNAEVYWTILCKNDAGDLDRKDLIIPRDPNAQWQIAW